MKEELPNEKLREAEDMEIDIKELLFKCLIHWPWFVGTVVACLIAAYVYLYVATPVYNISATVLIKDDKKGGASNNVGGLDELGARSDGGRQPGQRYSGRQQRRAGYLLV